MVEVETLLDQNTKKGCSIWSFVGIIAGLGALCSVIVMSGGKGFHSMVYLPLTFVFYLLVLVALVLAGSCILDKCYFARIMISTEGEVQRLWTTTVQPTADSDDDEPRTFYWALVVYRMVPTEKEEEPKRGRVKDLLVAADNKTGEPSSIFLEDGGGGGGGEDDITSSTITSSTMTRDICDDDDNNEVCGVQQLEDGRFVKEMEISESSYQKYQADLSEPFPLNALPNRPGTAEPTDRETSCGHYVAILTGILVFAAVFGYIGVVIPLQMFCFHKENEEENDKCQFHNPTAWYVAATYFAIPMLWIVVALVVACFTNGCISGCVDARTYCMKYEN